MDETVCELCGKISELSALEIHYIVPDDTTETTEETGASGSATAILCHECHQEIHEWYTKNVSTTAYNLAIQRFAPKPPADMAKEYKAAFETFAQYKKRQRNKV